MRLVALIAVVAAGGVGGFLLGSASAPDMGAARAAGVREGKQLAHETADRAGYRAGFDAGRARGFHDQYPSAYRQAFRIEFRHSGYDPPKRIEVPGA